MENREVMESSAELANLLLDIDYGDQRDNQEWKKFVIEAATRQIDRYTFSRIRAVLVRIAKANTSMNTWDGGPISQEVEAEIATIMEELTT